MLILVDSHTRIDVYAVVFHVAKQANRKKQERESERAGAHERERYMDTMQTTCWSESSSKHERQMGVLVPKTDSVVAPSTNHHTNWLMSNEFFFFFVHSLQWILFSDIFFFQNGIPSFQCLNELNVKYLQIFILNTKKIVFYCI